MFEAGEQPNAASRARSGRDGTGEGGTVENMAIAAAEEHAARSISCSVSRIIGLDLSQSAVERGNRRLQAILDPES